MSRPNDEGHRANDAPQDQTQIQQRGFAADGDEDKALAMMRARAALYGCTLLELTDGRFLICRSNFSGAAPGLREVGAYLRQIGRAA